MRASAGTRLESPAATARTEPGGVEPALGLAWTLVRTDFKVRYHGTVGGFVWALAKPLAMFALLLGVFSFVFGADPHYRLNLIIGLFLYEFFADATKTGLTSLATRGFLLTRAKCPAWILVLTSMANAVLTLLVFSAIIFVFLVLSGRPPAAAGLALYALYTLAFVVIVAGFALASSVVFLRYRDLNQVWDVAAQAGFFLAPVIYPLGILPERFHAYLYIWPPTPVIEFARAVLVRGEVPTATAHAYLAVSAALALGAGTLVYRRYGPRAAEYL